MIMPETIENYQPLAMGEKLKKQAWKVWTISALVVFLWAFLIVLAPLAETNKLSQISSPIYKFFSYLCHQQSERSFHIHEHQFAVCARCFGVYFGLFFGFLIYPLLRKIEDIEPLPRFWLFLALIPIGIDWTLGMFGIWENTHWSRFATGMILGFACAVFIVPSLVELVRLLTIKRRSR